MGTRMKMKNLFKGLRYISQALRDEEEQEMHIGYPTDIKHIAHIGWDGQSINNSPSWMSKFRSRPTLTEAENPSAACGGAAPNPTALDPHPGGGSATRGAVVHPRSSWHADSPSHDGSVPRTRSHQSGGSADSHSREPSERSKQGARKHRGGSSSAGKDHLQAVPKQPHRRKPKGSSSSSPRPKAAERSNGSGSKEQRSDCSKPASEREEVKH